MKAQFIKLDTVVIKPDTVDETTMVTDADGTTVVAEADDTTVYVNATNISSIRRLNYNDTIQTMILMIGGERFGVHQLPEEVIEMIEHATEHAY